MTGPDRHRGVPLFATPIGGEGGRLRPAAHAQLGEDAAHVVLGRLGADVEALADLGVGEAGTEQLEDVALALTESVEGGGRGSRPAPRRAGAEAAQEGGGA